MGNLCEEGGANVTCGGMDNEVPLEPSVEDQRNGKYTLKWSCLVPGKFMVFIKIDGLHVIGSPAVMYLTSGAPDMSKTEVAGQSLRKATAGKPSKVRINCKDAAGHPAVPGPSCTFGVTLVPASEPDAEAWRQYPAELLEKTLLNDQLELSFVPKLAGEIKACVWAAVEDSMKLAARSSGERRDQRQSAETVEPTAVTAAPQQQRPARKRPGRRESSNNSDNRNLLPGSPFSMLVTPGELSVKHSYVDAIQTENVHGAWEDVMSITVAGKPKAMMKQAEAKDKDKKEEEAAPSSRELEPSEAASLYAGDTIKCRPHVCDEFHNPVGAKNGTLLLVMTSPAGQETLPIFSQQSRGVWSHDVTYELRTKGHYSFDVLLDDVPISGCPIEFNVKNKTAS